MTFCLDGGFLFLSKTELFVCFNARLREVLYGITRREVRTGLDWGSDEENNSNSAIIFE